MQPLGEHRWIPEHRLGWVEGVKDGGRNPVLFVTLFSLLLLALAVRAISRLYLLLEGARSSTTAIRGYQHCSTYGCCS